MSRNLRLSLICSTFALAMVSMAAPPDGPDVSAFLPAQAAADILRDYAKTDGALIAADELKTTYSKENLSTLAAYPSDTIVVMNLTGSQLKQAFERSLSLFPQPNLSFLQLSGFEVVFNKNSPPNSRVTRVTVNGSPLDEKHVYSVAMPATLGSGALGYFKIWTTSQIVKNLDKSIESILAGKPFVATSPRWSSQ